LAENQEDRSREDLTEEASPHRIEEMRRKGQVAQSREITALLALIATAAAAYSLSPKMGAQLAEFMKEVFRTDLSARIDLGSTHIAKSYFMKALGIMISIGLPISLAGFVLGVVGSFSQIGAIFTLEPLQPDLNKINPLGGLQKLLSMKNAMEGLRIILKMMVVSAVAYAVVKTEVLSSPILMGEAPGVIIANYGRAAKAIFLALIGVLTVFAGIDFALQRLEYSKSTRMTKAEAKQEHKEREGDPQIRARIRAVQRDIARKRMMQAVKKADVIVTNPTHIAVAIVYDRSKMSAPRVVAKGADFVAQKIKQVAAEAGVPMVENVPLARALFKSVKIGQNIPRALYQAVAEVLAYVYRLRGKV